MGVVGSPLLAPSAVDLQDELTASVTRALRYLHEHQLPNGEFCTYFAADAPMLDWCQPDSTVFVTALVAECLLKALPAPEADEILTKATGFLQYQVGPGGISNHFTRLHPLRRLCPFDVDDTSCVSAVLRARGLDCADYINVPLLLANRDRRGLFYSWFLLRPRWSPHLAYWRLVLPELLHPVQSMVFWWRVEAHRNDVDAVVNANALYYLGDRPETQPIIAWLLRIVAAGQEADCDLWYRDAHAVYYFIARNYYAGIEQLAPARQPIIDRILAAAHPDGRLGETLLDTALAVCALLSWRATPPELATAVQYLLANQQAAGNWPRWLMYWGGPKKLQGWGSEELTTAFCLEALVRYQREVLG